MFPGGELDSKSDWVGSTPTASAMFSSPLTHFHFPLRGVHRAQRRLSVITYRIWQPKNLQTHGFLDWESYQRLVGPTIDPIAYDTVYEGALPTEDPTTILEALFAQFNLHRPNDFHGYSLSMGDIVWLEDTAYYCDTVGWLTIPFETISHPSSIPSPVG